MLMIIFFLYHVKKKINDNFYPTLNSTWPLKPGHASFMDIIYKNNGIDNFFLF